MVSRDNGTRITGTQRPHVENKRSNGQMDITSVYNMYKFFKSMNRD
jgi:hypothetical protein